MRCDAPLHKKSRVGSDEEEEGRDMESFEVNYVWVYTTVSELCASITVSELCASITVKCVESLMFFHRKKFQSFPDHKLRVCLDSRDGLEHARHKGKLHEALLDRREKMKADRYCK